ncbi:dockerin type I domain-containing protein, partial [candidate division KSB1 bacterium]|nr:dockerin type I domain-containing protein [candidate division KSB1 bacterium]
MKYFYTLSFSFILVSIFLSVGTINAQTQHFQTCWEGKQPFSPMTIFVIEAKFNGIDLIANDEIGIFDGELCVGAASIKSTVSISNILEIINSKDDGLTGRGFMDNNKIIVKIWRISTNQEFLIEASGIQFHDIQTGNPIDPVPFSGLGTAAISIKGLGKKGLSYHAKKLPLDMKPPTIDGKLDEPFWSFIKSDTLKFGGVPGVWQAPWTDWNNSYVTWKAVWSSITNKLYFAIRIKDDIRGTFDHSNPSDIFFQPWNDECIELFVNPNNAGGLFEGTYDKAQQWFITGENKIVLDDYPISSLFTIYTGSDLVSAVSLDSDGNWICEAVINIYTTFPSVGKILTIGDTLGWDIWYDDSDNLRLENNKYQRDYQTGWQYSGAADMNADFMGNLILAEELSYLILNFPNGGEFWQVDSLKTITWSSHNITGSVKIEISTDSGTTWQPITASTPNSGSFPWRPTANLISNQCLIKVTSLTDPMISDQSDATFIISNKSKVDLWIDSDLSAGPGGQAVIPIMSSDLTGKSVFSCTIVIQYDASVIQLTDTDISGTILAAAGWGKPTAKFENGQINLAMAGSSELSGSGVLLKIIGNVVGNAGDSTKLHFLSASINEDDPVVFTRDGLFKISKAADIKGRLVYYSDALIAVKDASVRLTGAVSQTSVSDNNGDYAFLNLALSNYSVTPEKLNDNKGAISPYDASLVLRYDVGIATLAPYQKIAADVSGNGTVSSYDASLILRYCVGSVSQF